MPLAPKGDAPDRVAGEFGGGNGGGVCGTVAWTLGEENLVNEDHWQPGGFRRSPCSGLDQHRTGEAMSIQGNERCGRAR